jgi:hypothetical protein
VSIGDIRRHGSDFEKPLNACSRAMRNLLPPTTLNLRIEAQSRSLQKSPSDAERLYWFPRAGIAGGVALLLFMTVGLFGSDQVAAIGSIAVALGGIVSLGSNASTLQQTMTAMSAAEARRSDLISRIDLRVVGDRRL